MKQLLKIMFVPICLFALTAFWYWEDDKDYFQSSYNDLTETQQSTFKWQDSDDNNKLTKRFRHHFFDTDLSFPRQKVTKVKLFKNIPMLGVFTGKRLKQNMVDSFVKLCNDSANFDWGETTWVLSKSKYYFRLYNSDDKVVGKIYFCLDDCFMTVARQFCPVMKFGMLSSTGFANITTLIKRKDN